MANAAALIEGWDWFSGTETNAASTTDALEHAFAKTFASADGQTVVAHLRETTLGRFLGPGASDAELRHLEGQRQLVAYIGAMIERGRAQR